MTQELFDLTVIQPFSGILFFLGSLLLAKISPEPILKAVIIATAMVGLVFEAWYQLTAWGILVLTDQEYWRTFYVWRYYGIAVAIIDLRVLWGIQRHNRRMLAELNAYQQSSRQQNHSNP